MKRATLALALLVSTSMSSFGSPSADDAAKLKSGLQSYFGTAADAIKVEPDGDGYKVTVDAATFAQQMKDAGGEIEMAPLSFHLVQKDGGKWKMNFDGPVKLSFKIKDQLSVEESFENYKMENEFDENLATITSHVAEAKNGLIKESITDSEGGKADITAKIDSITGKGSGSANAAGGVDLAINQHFVGVSLDETMAKQGEPPLPLQIKLNDGDFDLNLKGAKTVEFMSLLKFLNAHPDKDSKIKDQAALKSVLTALLPIAGNISGTGTFNKIEVQTPMGAVGLQKVTSTMNMNGLVKDGRFEEGFTVEGLSLPAGLVPAWATSLIPQNTSFNFAVSGYDAATTAAAYLNAMDISKDPPVAPDVMDGLLTSLLPKGTVDVSISKTSINNDTYAFTAEGSFTAGPSAVPSGKAHLTAKGLDEIMKVVQSSPPEAGLQDGAAMIIAAKGLGKAGADGTLTYEVEATPDGKVLINGTDMSQVGKQ